MIELRNIVKHFGEVHAVDGISFSTTEGEVFGLLGPNGAGKSTTIKMIMNIIAPDEGTILFDGKRISEKDKDRIGYLPEERGVYKKVKVNDMLLYFASLKDADMRQAQKRIDEWLRRLDLSDWKTRKCEDLSKGMAQKVQFITAITHDPDLIFLDEPFAGLDPVSTDVMREAVQELSGKGKTILFSTHNMEVAEKLCSKILIIDHGREVVSGALSDVKGRYGKKSVVVEFDGNIDFDRLSRLIAHVTKFPRWVEIELAEGASAQELLKILAAEVSIQRFEIVAPSLHKIFVDKLGNGKGVISNE
jgi:ABC-2 type transport system ATP-binding protein